MKKLYLLLLFISGTCWGQDSITVRPVQYLEKSVWRVSLIAPGLLNETRLGTQTTLVTSAQLSGVWASSGLLSYDTYINSYLSVGSRFFYNINKRVAKGNYTRSNSANYLMLRANYTFEPFTITYEPFNTIGVLRGVSVNALWGLQRTFQDNIYLNVASGIKVTPNGFGIAGNFVLGYTLPGRKSKFAK